MQRLFNVLTLYRYGNNKKEKNPRRGESRLQGNNAQEKRAHGGQSEKNGRIGITRLFCITKKLFVRWFNLYEHRGKYVIRTAEGKMDGQMNFLAIISRKDNPMLQVVLEEFDETISFLFDCPQP